MSLSDDKLRRARELFEELVDLTPPARAGRLRELRHLDQEIRSFTLAMLDSDRAALDMVAEPADGPEPNADIDPPPFELPGYRVGPRVGEGGSSVVYRARQLSTNRDVAIKLLRSVRLDPATRARFSYEARTASRLNHSGIARVFDSGVVRLGLDRAPYLVMEFVDGEPISEFCDSRGLGLRERLSLFGDVCDAVGHAHDRAVLHRDLKPSNILVDSAGSPRVVDFGTAISLVSDEREPAARTESGQVFGTIPYVAPERLLESGSPADVRTDVYALGVTLFELLAGRLPFDVDGRAPAELVSVVSEGRTTRLRAAIPDAPRDLDEVVARAIAFDPSFRYPSVRALSDDIGRYLDGRAVAARSGSSVYRLRKSIRRYRGPLAIGFAAAAALISVALLSIRAAQAERLARVASEDLVEFMGESFVAALEPEYAEPGRQQDRPIREVLDAAAAELDAGAGRFAEVPRVRERLERFFAETYLSIGLAPEAIAHSERVAALADSTEGPGSDRSVSARVLLAESLRASGRAQEAIAVIDMAEASTASGRASVDTLRLSVMRTRVDLLRTVDGDSERVRAAARELDDAITLLGGAGPPAPEEVAGAIETLAGVYLHLGDAENALRLVERGVKLALDSHGAAASETIAARKRRADVLRAIGRQREASE
ncbi:MAG: serine/threonine-protein kinase, partial [Planctomycetota bacterium]